ncbi:MAG: site-specific integrase [Thaumarchaeota archaeon]|nr:site-specific integrase [Nitrososphaerota archaeon]
METVSLKVEFERLRNYSSIQTWLNELGNNSQNTIRNALYSIYRYEKALDKNPDQLIDERTKESLSKNVKVRFRTEDTLKAFANNTKGGDTLASYVKSFYNANHLPLEISIQRPAPKREIEKIPSNEELFKLCTIAQGALRPLLYMLIESGARIGSVLQLKYGHIKEDYGSDKIPCIVRFPSKITKGNIPYVAFIGRDTVNSLREFIKIRQKQGEQITNDSYLFVSKNRKPLAKTTTITRIAKLGFKVGLNANKKGLKEFHGHILRKRAQTILESSGIPLNWVDYLLGHIPRGSQGGAYSRPTEEQLRDSYRVALPKLAVRPMDRVEQTDNMNTKMTMLMIAYSPEPPPTVDITGLSNEEFMELIQKGLDQKLKNKMTTNGSRQKVIPMKEVKNYIVQGWEYVASLPDSSAIVKLPA